ncbi:MAG TPA: hypothetical protein VK557_06420 [Pyrinomonadaceae bacterium]|nr:hypothetical protein [Pyrinomonadaceae bacterium]
MFVKLKTGSLLLLPLLAALLFCTQGVVSAPSLPNPVLQFTGAETVKQGDKTFNRYHFDVFNKDQFPDEMFAPAPTLPPCGKNTKSSRTWIDIYASNGKRLYGFCALKKSAELNQIYFDLEEGVVPPSYVYIEMNDRQTNTKYKSNLADTTQ